MNKTFAKLLIVLSILTSGVYVSSAAVCDNVTGYYKLEADGTDSVGTLGTAVGTAPSFASAGIIGNGGTFTAASSQYLRVPTFVGSTSYTVNIWYKPTTNVANSIISKDLVTAGNRVFNLSLSTTQITYYGWGTGSAFHQTTTANHGMSAGTWYMWTMVWDAANNLGTLYKNGTSFQTFALTGNQGALTTSEPMDIGRSGDATAYVNGVLDEVMYKTAASTAAEVTTLYSAGAPTSAVQCPATGGSTPQTLGIFRMWMLNRR